MIAYRGRYGREEARGRARRIVGPIIQTWTTVLMMTTVYQIYWISLIGDMSTPALGVITTAIPLGTHSSVVVEQALRVTMEAPFKLTQPIKTLASQKQPEISQMMTSKTGIATGSS